MRRMARQAAWDLQVFGTFCLEYDANSDREQAHVRLASVDQRSHQAVIVAVYTELLRHGAKVVPVDTLQRKEAPNA